jgi:hypothetical protein
MTQEQYIAQNASGFEGDTFLKEKVKSIVEKMGINCIIETGTYYGATTKQFLEMVPEVHTIEIVRENFLKAIGTIERYIGFETSDNNLKELVIYQKAGKTIALHEASSPDVLPAIIQETKNKRCLFFLDAHWQDYCPLLDELKLIADSGIEPVIVIHDFKVPNCPELGFDSYKGQDYTFEWIQPAIEKIYQDGYNYFYNTEGSSGAKRGVIFIYPGHE